MKKSALLALVIFIIAAIWIGSGLVGAKSTGKKKTNVATEQLENTRPEVRIQHLSAEEMEDTINVTGQTQASQSVIIRNETSGSIARLLVDKGDTVKVGQLMATLEIKGRAAKVQEAQQLVNQRRIEYTAAKELTQKGYSSRIRLSESLAQLELAKAQLKQAKVELDNVNIYAPFDGIINDKFVELGDYQSQGGDLFHLVQLDPIEIRGFATEKQINYLEKGSKVSISLLQDIELTGQVSFIASSADSNTRTFAFELSSENSDKEIKDGLTATIHIPIKEKHAYKISPSSLSLNDDGTVGVKTVTENDEVSFIPVRLLKDSTDYIWVSGLPQSIRLITVGHEFVVDSQKVKPVAENSLLKIQDQ